MKLLRLLFYQPYVLVLSYFVANFSYFAIKHTVTETVSTVSLMLLNIILISFVFRFVLKNSLLRLLNRFHWFDNISDHVLIGYLFIFTLFLPIPAVILAIIGKLFLWDNNKQTSYTDAYGNEMTQIKSLTPTVILSRKEKQTGEEEHIVMTKLKKKPRKIIYE